MIRVKLEMGLVGANNWVLPKESGVLQYYENHLKVRLKDPNFSFYSFYNKELLGQGAYVSRNYLKGKAEDNPDYFVTTREYKVPSPLALDLGKRIKAVINKRKELEIIEDESEFVVYDSNPEVDRKWTPEIPEISGKPKSFGFGV